jgi:hypothetical protein
VALGCATFEGDSGCAGGGATSALAQPKVNNRAKEVVVVFMRAGLERGGSTDKHRDVKPM